MISVRKTVVYGDYSTKSFLRLVILVVPIRCQARIMLPSLLIILVQKASLYVHPFQRYYMFCYNEICHFGQKMYHVLYINLTEKFQ